MATQSARPWTRWWWHGSAVDETNIARLLETYEAAGLGGVKVTCIYGVQGNEHFNVTLVQVKKIIDRQFVAGVNHIFYHCEDINLVNIDYGKFDASDWPVRPQGLAGPVTLTPLSSADQPAD